jgi:hypothetical protein
MTPQEKQMLEQQAYGITIAQVASCIQNHGGDHLDYAGSIARCATNRLAMLTAAGKFTPDQLGHIEALRVLINRITLAKELEDQAGLIENARAAQ